MNNIVQAMNRLENDINQSSGATYSGQFTQNFLFYHHTPATEKNQSGPIPDDQYILKSFTDVPPMTSDFFLHYRYHRTNEWLTTAQQALTDVLQPGFSKRNINFPLGSLQLNFFVEFMMQFQCIAKVKRTTRTTFKDEERTKVRYIKFSFQSETGLPPLKDNAWHIKRRSDLLEEHSSAERWDHVKSCFMNISFSINTEFPTNI